MLNPDNLDLNGTPFEGKKKLVNSVLIEFRTEFAKKECDAGFLNLKMGDHIVVQTQRGPFLAKVRSKVRRKLVSTSPEYRVIRAATPADLDIEKSNEKMETQAFHFAIRRIRAHQLDMKLVRAQSAHDGSKIVFYFSAEERVDFRSIVKDLAQKFRTRIEMFQIGARSGAGMIGGIGSCGRELCCSTFLSSFAPISIKMARSQGLSLNPEKVSGQCGRLMCCLIYEQQIYRRLKKKLPRRNQSVFTEMGEGKIIEVDLIGKRVIVQLNDNRQSFALDEIVLSDGTNRKPRTKKSKDADYLWKEEKKDAPSPQRKKRNRRKRTKSKDKATTENTASQSSQSGNQKGNQKTNQKGNQNPDSSDAPKKKRRRRRRRKKKPTEGSGNTKKD